MSARKRGLGRGLDALLGGAVPGHDAASSEKAALPDGGDLRHLAVDLIQRGRYQPRSDMRPDSLEDLAASIRAQGVVQPVVVRPHGEGRYELIAGERRWRAAQLAGLHEIPAVIREVPDEAAVAMALIENIQREDLNPLEEARALQRLIDEFSMTHQLAADAVGRSRAAVSNLLRLLDLDVAVKALLETRELEMGHARALLALPAERQAEVAREVVAKGLSVRATERLVKQLGSAKQAPKAAPKPDPDIVRLEQDLSSKLAAKVRVKHRGNGRGRLEIDYGSVDELEGILSHIK